MRALLTAAAALLALTACSGGASPPAPPPAVPPDVAQQPTAPVASSDSSVAGVLPPDRRTTWNPGVTYGGGGIPERSTVCAELAPSGGDDTERIAAAIATCPPEQVVQLAAGTFRINHGGISVRTSQVTLRGAGSGEPGTGEGGTRLVIPPDAPEYGAILYVGNHPGQFAESVALAEDAVQGSSQVVLTDDPGLRAGEYVLLDHVTNDDPQVVWGEFHDGPGGGSRRWFDRQDRSLSQIVEVTAVEGRTVTFATPLHWTFRTAFDAELSRYGDDVGGNVQPFVEWVGIEDLYLEGGSGGDYHGNVAISACAYCWVARIESNRSEGTAVGLYGTYRSEIRDSFIHSTSNPNPGGGGYLTGLNNGASDNLVENNVLWQGNKMVVFRATGGGNVFAYNYLEDGFGDGYRDIPEVGLNATHYTTPHMELLEGNQAWNFDGDSHWGNTLAITVYRNHLTGTRRDVAGLGLTDAVLRRVVGLNRFQWSYNFVANVLGEEDMALAGDQQRFVEEVTAPVDDGSVPMWVLGYHGEDPGQPFDPQVAATAVRHANFDHVSGATAYAPDLPRDLPPSLYLAQRPAFLADTAWPWVTPEDEDAPLAGVLPARARFDAWAL